jgi:mRNA-degrading endonuclease toxin of MazEF toxin-antitoxin module
VQRGQIYYAHFDPVIGSEQGGLRPAVVLQNNAGNKSSPTIIFAPITSQNKPSLPTHVSVGHIEELDGDSVLLLEQIRTLDRQRIKRYVAEVDWPTMVEVDIALKKSLGIRSDSKLEYFFTLIDWHVFEKWSFKAVFGVHTGLSMLLPQPGYADAAIESANMLSVDGMFIGRGWISERLNRGLGLWENWAEIRVPLVPGILAWDFFFDAAAVADKPENVFATDINGAFMDRMRFSFGGGLRFAIPMFPFRFLFAKRFKVVDGVVEWQRGSIWGGSSPTGGVDFVISFALSTY